MAVTELAPESRSVPKTASRLRASSVQFAAAEPATPNKVPISMLARSAEPCTHWYWGRIVHDMAGLKLNKDKVVVDWCHWWCEVMGYLDQFNADAKTGLNVKGYLVSTRPDDEAADVIAKGGAGVPYEASIEFDLEGSKIEFIGADQSTEVNGRTFQGPLYVVREWPLVAVAVCPHGADPNTSTEFSRGRRPDDKGSDDAEVSVQIFSKGPPMAKPNDKPAESNNTAGSLAAAPSTASAAPGAAPAADRAQLTADLKRFVDKFGGDNGAKWFSEGKSFEDALALHADGLQAQLKAKSDELAAEREKLASLSLGEETPIKTDVDQGGADAGKPNKFSGCLSPGLATFAAGIKLPTK